MNATLAANAVTPADELSHAGAALLRLGLRALVWWYPLLLVPGVLAKLALLPSWAAYALDEFVGFIYLYAVAWSAANRVSTVRIPIRIRTALSVAAAGMVVWVPFELALVLVQGAFTVQAGAQLLTIVMLILLGDIAFRYYFLFMPLVLGARLQRSTFAAARRYTAGRRALPLRVLGPPLVIMLLLWAVIRLPAPDARFEAADWALLLTDKIFWVLAVHLSVAAGLWRLDDRDWQRCRLDPYRAARLQTLRSQAPRTLASLLTVRTAVRLLVACLIVEAVNIVRLQAMPPSAQITVEHIRITGNKTELQLSLVDQEHRFRGFNPYFLRLAGENIRDVVAVMPSGVWLDPEHRAPFDAASFAGQASARLAVEFTTNRDTSALKDLRDLHLWYLGTKLMLLNMPGAEIGAASDESLSGRTAPQEEVTNT